MNKTCYLPNINLCSLDLVIHTLDTLVDTLDSSAE
jgi:hypothetical protein